MMQAQRKRKGSARRGFCVPVAVAVVLGSALAVICAYLALTRQAGSEILAPRRAESPPSPLPSSSLPTPPRQPTALKYPLWWAAPFRSQSGYGVEALSYVSGLLDYNLVRPEDLWLTQSGGFPNLQSMPKRVSDMLSRQGYKHQQHDLNGSGQNRPAIVICHSFPDFWLSPSEESYPSAPGSPCPTTEMKGKYIYRVGRTMFETDGLQQHLVNHLLQCDEIWVPTEFNRQTFRAAGCNRSNIYVLPESLDLALWNPESHQPMPISGLQGVELATGSRSGPKASFVFLSIFKWEARKGWEILLKAFLEEFKAEEGVELHIATHAFMEGVASWTDKVRRGVVQRCSLEQDLAFDKPGVWDSLPRVYITSRYIAEEEYPRLYKGADALVIPTRGEGWGRPQMEAMAMGLPVISTNWSGLTAFLNNETGYPIEVEALVDAKPDGPNFFAYFTGTKWAQPSVKHLRQLMRHVVSHPDDGKAKGRAAREFLAANFSPEAVARSLHELVLGVQARAEAKHKASWI